MHGSIQVKEEEEVTVYSLSVSIRLFDYFGSLILLTFYFDLNKKNYDHVYSSL